LEDDRRGAAQAILDQVQDDLSRDELALSQGLADALRKRSREAAKLLASVPSKRTEDEVPRVIKPPESKKWVTTIDRGEGQGWDATQLSKELEDLRRRLEADPALRVSLSWTLFKEEET
jgi:hypothetical protein